MTIELECGLCIRRRNVMYHALPFPISLDLDAYRVLGSGQQRAASQHCFIFTHLLSFLWHATPLYHRLGHWVSRLLVSITTLKKCPSCRGRDSHSPCSLLRIDHSSHMSQDPWLGPSSASHCYLHIIQRLCSSHIQTRTSPILIRCVPISPATTALQRH